MNLCGPLAQLVEQFPLRNGSMVRVHHGSPLFEFNLFQLVDNQELPHSSNHLTV